MKSKILLSAIALFTVTTAFSQDTSYLPAHSKVTFKDNPQTQSRKLVFKKKLNKHRKDTTVMYRDTRLGSSSPLYNTYKKNDNGAGSVTTNPNKINTSRKPRIIIQYVDSSKIKQ
ncbi:MAG: hypothetical protein ABI204_05930 [Ginsengibacter sp.]